MDAIEPERIQQTFFDLAKRFHGNPKGKYRNKWPEGAIVHYSATPTSFTAARLIEDMRSKDLHYHIIDPNGELFLADYLDSWGYHAGPSYWPGLENQISNRLCGIEIMCPGKSMEDDDTNVFYPWWLNGEYIPFVQEEDLMRGFSDNFHNIKKGIYWPFTPNQEATLATLLQALKSAQPTVFNFDHVLGHDEVRGPSNGKFHNWEKTDPGGCLSMTMPAYREMLKQTYEMRNK